MARYFTYYWKNNTVDEANYEGERALWAASNGFTRRGIEIGDYIYGVTIKKGKLFLINGIHIGKIYLRDAWAKQIGVNPDELWNAEEFLIAQRSTTEHLHFHLEVPIDVTRRLLFFKNACETPLNFVDLNHQYLDRQTLRTIREMPESTALIFNKLLDEFVYVTEDWIIQEFLQWKALK